MQVWNVLHVARWKYRTQKLAKKSLSGHHRTTLSGYIIPIKARIDNRKKLVKQNPTPRTAPKLKSWIRPRKVLIRQGCWLNFYLMTYFYGPISTTVSIRITHLFVYYSYLLVNLINITNWCHQSTASVLRYNFLKITTICIILQSTNISVYSSEKKLECGPVPNVMAALPNIGGALCSMPQSGWRPLPECRAVTLPKRETRWN